MYVVQVEGAMKNQGQGKPKATLVKSVKEIMVPHLLTIVWTFFFPFSFLIGMRMLYLS